MSITIMRTALGVAALSLSLTHAVAQQAGQQMPGMAHGPAGSAATCAQNSQGVTRALDVVNLRIEDARQSNDASKLRGAVGDLQVVLAQMKTQLADCVALAGETGGVAMANMPGMDHSKMPMAPGMPVMQPRLAAPSPGAQAAPMVGMDHSKMQMAPGTAPKPSGSRASAPRAKASDASAGMDHSKTPAAKTTRTEPPKMAGMDHSKMAGEKAAPAAAGRSSKAAQAAVVFTLRTQPAPPRSGKNDFEVTVKDPDGKPIADADVSMAFYLPPMPSMKIPEMRNTVKLTSAGGGIYKGSGTIGMAGDWDVTVTASRNGQQLDAKKMKLTAK